MVNFLVDVAEYVERTEQVKYLELMITIQQLFQLQSKYFIDIKLK